MPKSSARGRFEREPDALVCRNHVQPAIQYVRRSPPVRRDGEVDFFPDRVHGDSGPCSLDSVRVVDERLRLVAPEKARGLRAVENNESERASVRGEHTWTGELRIFDHRSGELRLGIRQALEREAGQRGRVEELNPLGGPLDVRDLPAALGSSDRRHGSVEREAQRVGKRIGIVADDGVWRQRDFGYARGRVTVCRIRAGPVPLRRDTAVA